jgi:hypothetical protein
MLHGFFPRTGTRALVAGAAATSVQWHGDLLMLAKIVLAGLAGLCA